MPVTTATLINATITVIGRSGTMDSGSRLTRREGLTFPRRINRLNAKIQKAEHENLGTTGQPSANGQTNAKSRKSGGQGGQSNQPGGTAADKKSTQTSRQQGNEAAGTKRTAGGAGGQGSNDVTSGLDREASARQRGSQNVNLQQKSQQRATQGDRAGRERQSRSANARSRQRN